jgi:hypothetical protein
VSSRCSVPDQRRASSAAHWKVDAARAASAVAHFTGLPLSAPMSSATSPARSTSRAETWNSAAARAAAVSASRAGAAAGRRGDGALHLLRRRDGDPADQRAVVRRPDLEGLLPALAAAGHPGLVR